MSSTAGLIRKWKQRKPHKSRSPALKRNPQQSAIVKRSFITTPRKPNSALRKVAKIKYRNVVKFQSTIKYTFAFIPGEVHTLKEHGVVLFRGGRTQDLPGMKYKLIRGKFDFKGLVTRRNARSKYGAQKPAKK